GADCRRRGVRRSAGRCAREQHGDVAAERLVVERGIQAAQDRLDEAERAPAAGESLDELHAGKVLHRTGHCLGRAAVDVDVATRLRSAQPLNEAPQLARALMGEDEIGDPHMSFHSQRGLTTPTWPDQTLATNRSWTTSISSSG